MRVFPEMGMWWTECGRWALTVGGQHLTQRSPERTKRKKRRFHYSSFLELGHPASPALGHQNSRFLDSGLATAHSPQPPPPQLQSWMGITPLASLVLKPFDLDRARPLACIVVQPTDGLLWSFSASIILWVNYSNKSLFNQSIYLPSIYPSIHPVGSISLEKPKIHTMPQLVSQNILIFHLIKTDIYAYMYWEWENSPK